MVDDFEQVEARGLVKMYGTTRALAGVDLVLRAGEVTVVEGPNGSGKSTLLSLLAQLARPTEGVVRYGERTGKGRAGEIWLRRHIGVLSHAAMVYPDLTGRENLHLYARLHAQPEPRAVVDRMIERFEIGRFVDRPVRTYSRGQLQRVALARALMHSPRLILLDEPSTGLDRAGVDRLATAIDAEKTRGAIAMLITHDPALADRLADRRVRLDRGRVLEEPS